MSRSMEAGPQLLWATHLQMHKAWELRQAQRGSPADVTAIWCLLASLDPWSRSLASMDGSGASRKNFYVCASQTLLTRVCPVEEGKNREKGKIAQRGLGRLKC